MVCAVMEGNQVYSDCLITLLKRACTHPKTFFWEYCNRSAPVRCKAPNGDKSQVRDMCYMSNFVADKSLRVLLLEILS